MPDLAILFADVAGSTALYEVLGDERAFGLVEQCLSAMAACTTEAGGRVVKTIGDAVMAVFASADGAAGAAVAMQQRVRALGPGQGTRLRLRIGFHFGPVVERDGDVFGDSVNLASRLCDLASTGQIVTDDETARGLSVAHRCNLRALYSVPVKGKEREVEVVELAWAEAGEEKTVIALARPKSSATAARLELVFEGRRIEMGPERRKVTIGRDHEADFPVRDRAASRAHATIERRRERFVLADHSSNGTWVGVDGHPETRVHHEDLPLAGHGYIACGQPGGDGVPVVEFRTVDAAPAG